jgi:hypothetical protein
MVCTQDEFSEWHARECLFGECESYKVDIFPICLIKEDGTSNSLVSWRHFSLKKIVTKKGEEKKKLKLTRSQALVNSSIISSLSFNTLFARICGQMVDVQFRTYLENFPAEVVVLVIDFVENYSFEI